MAPRDAVSRLQHKIDLLEKRLEAICDVLSNDDINDKGKVVVALGIAKGTLMRQ